MRMSNKHPLDGVARRMVQLNELQENALFVSQHMDCARDQASVFISFANNDENYDEDGVLRKGANYLMLRRLLSALEYRINEDTGLEFHFTLKRKAKR